MWRWALRPVDRNWSQSSARNRERQLLFPAKINRKGAFQAQIGGGWSTVDTIVPEISDSCGPAAGNLNLSERRAESVAADLANRLEERTIHVFGMGESAGAFGDGLRDSRSHRSARVFLLAPDGEGD